MRYNLKLMRYCAFIILMVLLGSCSSSKKVQTYKTEDVEIKTTEDINAIELVDKVDFVVIDTTKVEFDTIEITVTEFEVTSDTLSNTIISLPKKITTTKKTNLKIQQGKTESSIKTETTTTYNKETDTEIIIDKEEKTVTKKKFSNNAIVRMFYLIVVVILMAYIIIKKYFPSIFVKVRKLLML